MRLGLHGIVDEAIIDKLFQPVCNWLNGLLGCTKRVPVVVGYVVSIIALFPLITSTLSLGGVVSKLLALSMVLYCFVRSWVVSKLVIDELNGFTEVIDSNRITGYKDRIATLVLSVVTSFLVCCFYKMCSRAIPSLLPTSSAGLETYVRHIFLLVPHQCTALARRISPGGVRHLAAALRVQNRTSRHARALHLET